MTDKIVRFQYDDPNTSPDGSKAWIPPEECDREIVKAKNFNDCIKKGGVDFDPKTGDCTTLKPKKD